MDCNERQVSPKIAYLIKCFPRLSETFILHEVLELERQGLPLLVHTGTTFVSTAPLRWALPVHLDEVCAG